MGVENKCLWYWPVVCPLVGSPHPYPSPKPYHRCAVPGGLGSPGPGLTLFTPFPQRSSPGDFLTKGRARGTEQSAEDLQGDQI